MDEEDDMQPEKKKPKKKDTAGKIPWKNGVTVPKGQFPPSAWPDPGRSSKDKGRLPSRIVVLPELPQEQKKIMNGEPSGGFDPESAEAKRRLAGAQKCAKSGKTHSFYIVGRTPALC